jgi:hypothetical protein
MSEVEPSPPRVGATLRGKWTLEKLLGEGGMASVWVARHKIGRLDAIKILHPLVAASPQLRARFEQEARVVNRFRHPGAVEIRDIDTTEDGSPFLVMELLEGETLAAVMNRGGVDVAMVLDAADQVLDVLSAAHAQGIIHRDIKPDNLLRLADGRIKVLDFGIARVREGANEEFRTRTGTTLGTVAYMPPEQAKGAEIDARADLYSVGATMFRMLAGRRVHEADTEAERLAKLVTAPAPSLASVAPGVPEKVCAVVDRALTFDRDRRYPDAATMQSDVRAVKGGAAPAHAVKAAAVAEAPTRAEMPAKPEPARTPTVPLPAEGPALIPPARPYHPPTVQAQPAPPPLAAALQPKPDARAILFIALGAGLLLLAVGGVATWLLLTRSNGLDVAAPQVAADASIEPATSDESPPNLPPPPTPTGPAGTTAPTAPATTKHASPAPSPPPPGPVPTPSGRHHGGHGQ